MLEAIKSWFAAPYFPGEDEKNRITRLMTTINSLFMFILAIAGVIFVPIFAVHKTLGFSIVGGMLLMLVAARELMRRGRVDQSNTLLVVGAWLVFQGMVILSGSIYSPVLIAVVAIITLTGLLLKTRYALGMVLVSIICGFGLAFLEMNQVKMLAIFHYSPLAAWFWFSLALGFVFGIVSLVTRTLYAALQTERHQRLELQASQVTLRESEEKFRQMVEQSFEAYILSDEQGNLIEWNRAAENLTGKRRDQVLGRPIWDVQMELTTPNRKLPRVAEMNRQAILSLLATGQMPVQEQAVEVVYSTAAGEHTWVQQTSFPITTSKGFRLAVVTRDITERKHIELELQAIAALSAALRTAASRAEMLPAIVEQLVELLDADAISIAICDEKTGGELVEAAYGGWREFVGTSLPAGEGLNAVIRKTLKPYVSGDIEQDPNRPDPAWLRCGIRAVAGVPLLARQDLIGFIWRGAA